MIELLPGILWLTATEDCTSETLRAHGVTVLVTDRDDLGYGTVLRVTDPRDTERVASDLARLYAHRVCAAIVFSTQSDPRPLQRALVREVAGVRDPDEVEALVEANYYDVAPPRRAAGGAPHRGAVPGA